MTILQGAILGLIQGLSEFLPISSSAHMMLGQMLMGIDTSAEAFKMLVIMLHFGTLIPVIILFWKDWIDMLLHPIKNRTLGLLFLASLPALAFYIVFDMDVFDNGWFLGVAFLITAGLLTATDLIHAHRDHGKKEVGVLNALCMGIMQGFGLMPGISRSGSTVFGGVASGLARKTAAKFSFMMSAPAILASLLVEGKHALDDNLFASLELLPTLAGIVVAAVVGYLAIRFFLWMITRVPLRWFALYVALLGLGYLLLQLTGNPLVPPFVVPELSQVIAIGH